MMKIYRSLIKIVMEEAKIWKNSHELSFALSIRYPMVEIKLLWKYQFESSNFWIFQMFLANDHLRPVVGTINSFFSLSSPSVIRFLLYIFFSSPSLYIETIIHR